MDPKEMGSKGGKARAAKLSPEERSEIARNAALDRWEVPKATHSGNLEIGNLVIPCAVLEDGTRVLTQRGFLESLGRHGKANVRREGGEERIPAILQGKAINPFISKELLEKSRPIVFRPETGARASGRAGICISPTCRRQSPTASSPACYRYRHSARHPGRGSRRIR